MKCSVDLSKSSTHIGSGIGVVHNLDSDLLKCNYLLRHLTYYILVNINVGIGYINAGKR